MARATVARTMLQKIYDRHRVAHLPGGEMLLYVDFHLLTDATSAMAFAGLRERGIWVRRPDRTLAIADHNVSTARGGLTPIPRTV